MGRIGREPTEFLLKLDEQELYGGGTCPHSEANPKGERRYHYDEER